MTEAPLTAHFLPFEPFDEFRLLLHGRSPTRAPTASYHFKNTCDKKKNEEFSGGGEGRNGELLSRVALAKWESEP